MGFSIGYFSGNTFLNKLMCLFVDADLSIFVSQRINIEDGIIGTIGIQVQPIAAVSALLCKAGDDRIVEACSQVILLRDWVKLLAGEFEAIGDGFLLGRKVAPSVIVIVVKDNAIFINDVGG